MLEIRNVQYFVDGRSVVETVGGRRFWVITRGHRDGYDTAKVEFIKDRPIMADEQQGMQIMFLIIYISRFRIPGAAVCIPYISRVRTSLKILKKS